MLLVGFWGGKAQANSRLKEACSAHTKLRASVLLWKQAQREETLCSLHH